MRLKVQTDLNQRALCWEFGGMLSTELAKHHIYSVEELHIGIPSSSQKCCFSIAHKCPQGTAHLTFLIHTLGPM